MNESAELDAKYNVLFGTTISIRVQPQGPLFDPKAELDVDERIAKSAAELLKGSPFELRDIKNFAGALGLEPFVELPKENQLEPFLRYGPPYAPAAQLDFNDSSGKRFNETWRRYFIFLLTRKAKDRPILNEWGIIGSKDRKYASGWEKYAGDWKVAYDLLVILGIRRSGSFTPNLALRTFNLCLPIGRLKPRDAKKDDGEGMRKQLSRVSTFLVTPIITLNMKPGNSYFRRTISLSLVLVPVGEEFTTSRKVTAYEMAHLSDTEFELQDSPLKEFLELLEPKSGIHPDCLTAAQLAQALIMMFYHKTRGSGADKIDGVELEELFNQMSVSEHNIQVLLSPSLVNKDVENFYRNSISPRLREELRSIVLPRQYFYDGTGEPFPDTVEFQRMVIADEAKADATGLDLFSRPGSNLIEFYYAQAEDFPRRSIKWGLPWAIYMNIGTSVLGAMIHSFYQEIESKERSAKTLISVENNFIDDIEEFYDLDIIAPNYKERYEKLRDLSGMDADFRALKEKLASLKTNVVLEDQGNQDQYLVLLAIVSAAVGAIAVLIALFR
ncbi:MAG: hypothetical protein JRM78_03930 [Nitrososphaerota archaeon]|nr:hypothetical protein [Nitrososphaerota archaeon]